MGAALRHPLLLQNKWCTQVRDVEECRKALDVSVEKCILECTLMPKLCHWQMYMICKK